MESREILGKKGNLLDYCGSRTETDEKEQTEASTLVLLSLTFINVTFQILYKLCLQEITKEEFIQG